MLYHTGFYSLGNYKSLFWLTNQLMDIKFITHRCLFAVTPSCGVHILPSLPLKDVCVYIYIYVHHILLCALYYREGRHVARRACACVSAADTLYVSFCLPWRKLKVNLVTAARCWWNLRAAWPAPLYMYVPRLLLCYRCFLVCLEKTLEWEQPALRSGSRCRSLNDTKFKWNVVSDTTLLFIIIFLKLQASSSFFKIHFF